MDKKIKDETVMQRDTPGTPELIVPSRLMVRHTRAKQEKAMKKAITQYEKTLRRAYRYIESLERFVISYGDLPLMSPLDLEFFQALIVKHAPQKENKDDNIQGN